MKERSKEINVHKDMITSQIKANELDRQTVRYNCNYHCTCVQTTPFLYWFQFLSYSSELHSRISKIDRLRKRYEMVMVAMAPPEGEEEHSQTYYVIKVRVYTLLLTGVRYRRTVSNSTIPPVQSNSLNQNPVNRK